VADPTALIAALQPVLEVLADADPAEEGLAAQLAAKLPLDGDVLQQVRVLMDLGLEQGWLCPKESGGVRFGRLAKAGPATEGYSIDAVDMSGPGPGHTHPEGEIDLCFAIEGDARFDGRAPGWTCYGPGSWHVPTVTGGRMAILYFLPDGAIRFEPKPSA